MASDETLDRVRALVASLHPVPDDTAAPLDLDSLTTVMLVEALEDRLAIRVAARDVVPENFGTLEAVAAFVERKRVSR